MTPSVMTQVMKIKNKIHVQSNLYQEVTIGTNKKWSYKTGDLLKEVQFI